VFTPHWTKPFVFTSSSVPAEAVVVAKAAKPKPNTHGSNLRFIMNPFL
jgi:hypothetical protein